MRAESYKLGVIPGAVRGSCDERTGSMKLKEVGARRGLTKDGGVLRTGQSLDFCGNRGRAWKQMLQHRKLKYGESIGARNIQLAISRSR